MRILEDAENLLLAERRVAIIDQRGCAPVQVPRARRFEKTIQPFLCLEPPFTVVCLKRNLIPSPTPAVKSRIAKEVDSIEAVAILHAEVRLRIRSHFRGCGDAEIAVVVFEYGANPGASEPVFAGVDAKSGCKDPKDTKTFCRTPEVTLAVLGEA